MNRGWSPLNGFAISMCGDKLRQDMRYSMSLGFHLPAMGAHRYRPFQAASAMLTSCLPGPLACQLCHQGSF